MSKVKADPEAWKRVIKSMLEENKYLTRENKQKIIIWLKDKKIPKEEWRKIPNFPDIYEISNLGRIRTWHLQGSYTGNKSKKPRIKKPFKQNIGYLETKLYKNGKGQSGLIHRLVASAFIPNPENKPEINHKLPIKTFNWAINLEWSTSSENTKHAFSRGLMSQTGSKNSMSKLTEEDVLKIRERYKRSETQKEIAESYGVTRQAISDIITRRNWKHI